MKSIFGYLYFYPTNVPLSIYLRTITQMNMSNALKLLIFISSILSVKTNETETETKTFTGITLFSKIPETTIIARRSTILVPSVTIIVTPSVSASSTSTIIPPSTLSTSKQSTISVTVSENVIVTKVFSSFIQPSKSVTAKKHFHDPQNDCPDDSEFYHDENSEYWDYHSRSDDYNNESESESALDGEDDSLSDSSDLDSDIDRVETGTTSTPSVSTCNQTTLTKTGNQTCSDCLQIITCDECALNCMSSLTELRDSSVLGTTTVGQITTTSEMGTTTVSMTSNESRTRTVETTGIFTVPLSETQTNTETASIGNSAVSLQEGTALYLFTFILLCIF